MRGKSKGKQPAVAVSMANQNLQNHDQSSDSNQNTPDQRLGGKLLMQEQECQKQCDDNAQLVNGDNF